MILAVLVGPALLLGCGGESEGRTTVSAVVSGPRSLTPADARKIRLAAVRDRFVRELAGGSRVRLAGQVVPWLSADGRKLLGGVVQLALAPAVDFEDQKLPVTISPNQKAPPGTPTLYRFARMSATDVSRLEVEVRLADAKAVRIEPSGDGYTVTKLELIGPPPTGSAYAPEPGY
jgi:hypothetical protein